LTCDILVIGGGVVGCGIARDAAMRGLRTCLVEQADLASGTSSRSSKLVHGGLRYLEHGEFSLVFEAVTERRVLMEIAPHLVNPLGFVFPVYKDGKRSVLTLNIGMWLYDGLSLFRSPRIHRNLSPQEVAEEEPSLLRDGLKGAPLYYDCSTDDARLTLETAMDAARHGADVHTWTRMVGLDRDPSGRVKGARVQDVLEGREWQVEARAVVNATGPWTDRVREAGRPLLRLTKGVHIVVDHRRLPVKNACVIFHPGDGRLLFAIPWGDRTYVGTTDTDWQGDPSDVAADAADVTYLLAAANAYFPDARLGPDHVIATWAGLRPLISAEGSESSVSREHEILVDADGLVTIAGGKLTTYRKMAKEAVDRAVALLRLTGGLTEEPREAHTARHALPGAVGWPEDDDHGRVEDLVRGVHALPAETVTLLVNTYGTRAIDLAKRVKDEPALGAPLVQGRPEILAQVAWAVDREMARTVRDVMMRRTQLYLRDVDQGLGAVEVVAGQMARQLGWGDERRAAEVEAYRREVGRSRAWRQG
jgi:glycerol-3-phosphate dehydrogenase